MKLPNSLHPERMRVKKKQKTTFSGIERKTVYILYLHKYLMPWL